MDYFRELNFVSVALRLLLSALIGFSLGLERGRKRRPAGCRTYMLVCMGATLTLLLSQYEYIMVTTKWASIASEIGLRTDVSRFGAQVIRSRALPPRRASGPPPVWAWPSVPVSMNAFFWGRC